MKPGTKSGSPNLGGPLVTSGGLVFTAAAMDTWIRAFDAATGAELWKAELPASGQSTPMTYERNGRQYIVILRWWPRQARHEDGRCRGRICDVTAAQYLRTAPE